MLTDVLLEKLELPATPGWAKTLIPAEHARIRSARTVSVTSHMSYCPLVRWSISNAPISLSAGNNVADIVGRASGRPLLVRDPLDFLATSEVRWNPYGTYRVGLLKSIGGDYLNPTVCKAYGAVGPQWRFALDVGTSTLRPEFLRPIFYVEDGEVLINGALHPFTLDPITREVRVNDVAAVPSADVLASGLYNSNRYPTFAEEQGGASSYYTANFKHWTPMKVKEFGIRPISGQENQFPAVLGGKGNCEGYFMSMTLEEVIPQFDPILTFYTTEVNGEQNVPVDEDLHTISRIITMSPETADPDFYPPDMLQYSPTRNDVIVNPSGGNNRFFFDPDQVDNTFGGDGLSGGYIDMSTNVDERIGAYVETPLIAHVSPLAGPFNAEDYTWELKTRQLQSGLDPVGGVITNSNIVWAIRQGPNVYLVSAAMNMVTSNTGTANSYTQRSSPGVSNNGSALWMNIDTESISGDMFGTAAPYDPNYPTTTFGMVIYVQGPNQGDMPLALFHLRDFVVNRDDGAESLSCYGVSSVAVGGDSTGCFDPNGGGS